MEISCVLAFAGHMIDKPKRIHPRFPSSIENVIRDEIRNAIQRLAPVVAVSSAACGGDIIFAEEVLEQNIPLYIILPFEDTNDFIERSVIPGGAGWESRFHKVYERARGTYFVKPGSYRSDKDFEDNQYSIIFFSLGVEAIIEKQLVCLVLYDDTQPIDGIGGTSSFLDLCRGLKIPFERINLLDIRNRICHDW